MKLTLTSLRRIVFATVTLLLTIGVVWWGLWSLAASRYRGVIDGWIATQRASGYQISFEGQKLFGFPRSVVFRFHNLHWQNTDGISFLAHDIDISAIPWQWQKFNAKFKHQAEIITSLDENNQSLVLRGESGTAHIELNDAGYWTLSRISLESATLGRSPDYLVSAQKLKASAVRPTQPPLDHRTAGLTLEGEAESVALPDTLSSPFGSALRDLTVKMRVMGRVPDVRRKDSVETWNNDSGVVEFDTLHMEWGPLLLTAKGTMGFDDDLQPEGAFSSTLSNLKGVLKALMDHDFIAKHDEGMLDSAVNLFAKPSQVSAAPGIEVPIAVQLGGLFLGPVRIFTFPEIIWPIGPPPNTPAAF